MAARLHRTLLQAVADRITDNLGLERLRGFDAKVLFSEVFRRRSGDDLERLLAAGTPDTTPPLVETMGQWPRPWLFLRALAFSLAVHALLLAAWMQFSNLYVVPALIVSGCFAVPLATALLFFELNTPRNVSFLRVLQLGLLGGATAILISLVIFKATRLTAWLGAPAAAFVEETAKLAALLLLARFARRARHGYLLNGLLFGASVGAGFAAFESAGYALRYGLASSEAMLANITLRGLLAPFGHIAWSAIVAGALWRARGSGKTLPRALVDRRFLALFALTVALHFIWNAPLALPWLSKFLLLGFVAWIVILSLVQTGLAQVATAARARLNQPLDIELGG